MEINQKKETNKNSVHPAADLPLIYLEMVSESVTRLRAAQSFLSIYANSNALPDLESAILQVRKALEAMAFASIAPNKSKYEAFRAKANEQPDYTKDYHAKKIFRVLNKINKNFYPLALLPAAPKPDGILHFERKPSGYLTKKRFESLYDRLGKYLHAHNPWSNNKNLQNLAAELPTTIDEVFSLLELHATFIQTTGFSGTWVVAAHRDGTAPRVIIGESTGEFIVERL